MYFAYLLVLFFCNGNIFTGVYLSGGVEVKTSSVCAIYNLFRVGKIFTQGYMLLPGEPGGGGLGGVIFTSFWMRVLPGKLVIIIMLLPVST